MFVHQRKMECEKDEKNGRERERENTLAHKAKRSDFSMNFLFLIVIFIYLIDKLLAKDPRYKQHQCQQQENELLHCLCHLAMLLFFGRANKNSLKRFR